MIKAIYYQFHYTQIISKKVTSHTNKNGQDTVYLPFLNNASVANLTIKFHSRFIHLSMFLETLWNSTLPSTPWAQMKH